MIITTGTGDITVEIQSTAQAAGRRIAITHRHRVATRTAAAAWAASNAGLDDSVRILPLTFRNGNAAFTKADTLPF